MSGPWCARRRGVRGSGPSVVLYSVRASETNDASDFLRRPRVRAITLAQAQDILRSRTAVRLLACCVLLPIHGGNSMPDVFAVICLDDGWRGGRRVRTDLRSQVGPTASTPTPS